MIMIVNSSFGGVPMTNSSVFSGMGITSNQGQNLNQSVDFSKNTPKSIGSRTPFPTSPEAFNQSKKMETEIKCLIPNCQNQRLVHKGMTYPVCGRKCWLKWQNQPKGPTFWT